MYLYFFSFEEFFIKNHINKRNNDNFKSKEKINVFYT